MYVVVDIPMESPTLWSTRFETDEVSIEAMSNSNKFTEPPPSWFDVRGERLRGGITFTWWTKSATGAQAVTAHDVLCSTERRE